MLRKRGAVFNSSTPEKLPHAGHAPDLRVTSALAEEQLTSRKRIYSLVGDYVKKDQKTKKTPARLFLVGLVEGSSVRYVIENFKP